MLHTTTRVVVILAATSSPVSAQSVPDTVQQVLELHALIEKHGTVMGPRIWPQFRPDTIPSLYVIAHQGKVLVQWRHPWPEGFTLIPGRSDAGTAGSQMISFPSGKFLAFNSVDSTMSPGLVLGTAIHEAFHSFERSAMREGRMFGAWENAMLVGAYPVFDVENEAGFALEGKKLRQAMEARDSATTTTLAREFLLLRERRHTNLRPEYAEFERMAELNEGLAQYSLISGLREVGRLEGAPWDARAEIEARNEAELLDRLLELGRQSIRRRFYATGSSMALILDRLTGDRWKQKILEDNLNLQEALAWATDHQGAASVPEASTRRLNDQLAVLRGEATAAVTRLKHTRAAQGDSVLRQPGLRLTLDPGLLPAGTLQWCGFDPQNTLVTGDGRTLHMRFLRACAGDVATGEFDQPVVQFDSTGALSTVLDTTGLQLGGAEGRITIDEGETREVAQFRLTTPKVTLTARRARVSRKEGGLTVLVLPQNP